MRSLERVNIRTNVRTTFVRTYSHTYVRDRPYIPSTTLLCEGIIRVCTDCLGISVTTCLNCRARSELQIRGVIEDNSKIMFFISQKKKYVVTTH